MRPIRVPPRHVFRFTVCLLILCLSPAAWAQPAAKDAEVAVEPSRRVTVHLGQSTVVRAPWPVKRVSVTDPKIADVQGLTADRVLLMGKSLGLTDLLMWNETEQLWQAKVEVRADLSHLKTELGRLLPGARLDISQSHDLVIIGGVLARAEQAAQLRDYMKAIKLPYLDATRLPGVQQVQLQVRVAEVSRTAIRTLGLNAFYTGREFFVGSTVGADGGGPLNPISIGVPAKTPAGRGLPFQFTETVGVSSAVTLFAGFPDADFQFFLQALAENQYLRILAEPNLVALSGEQANFLAGGEFPIPVVQGGLQGSTSISIEYKEFGVRLRFRPTVLGEGGIRLQVATEVSDLSDVGAVIIQGFRVPAIVTRRADTTLELRSGQTFGMAGLINRTNNARNSRIPGIGDLPILGALFRSVRYSVGETELVVLVKADLVEPLSADPPPPVPGMLHSPPDDWEFYALGRLEGKAPARLSAAHAEWLRQKGLDRLVGPGAWARHDSLPAPIRQVEKPTATPTAAPAAP